MNTRRDNRTFSWLVALAATLATLAVCRLLLRFMPITSFAFSWQLNFCLMIWFTIVETYLPLPLNSTYFAARPFEKGGRIYIFLGVSAFRRLLRLVGWEKVTQKNFPIEKTQTALQQCERSTRVSELGHLVIGLIVLGVAAYVCVTYSFMASIWLLSLNLLFNLYPILLQRYNRPRYRRAIAAVQARQQPSHHVK